MNRRQLLSLSLLSVIPIPEGLRPVRVDPTGLILDAGSFPKEGVADLQLHLDWLHTDPEYFLRIDFPIKYVGECPEQWERLIAVNHDLNYRAPIVDNYRVVDAGTWPGLLYPGMRKTYLDQEEMAELHEVLEIAKADPDFRVFANYPIRCTDPALQARVLVFDEASAEEIDAQRDAWDRWIVEPSRLRGPLSV